MDIEPKQYIELIGSLPDAQIDLARASICLAAVNYEGRNLERYFHHLNVLAEDVGVRHKELLDTGSNDDSETRVAALKHALVEQHGYIGDSENYDDLQNADMIAVIDRVKGLPISLCILYLHAAQAQGWNAEGLNVPGHFVVRLEKDGRRLIFDPFYGAGLVEAPQLREIVKKAIGPDAELSSEYFEAAPKRDILIRLQNNIKRRQIESEDYLGAIKTIENMQMVAPKEYRLWLDAGVLYSKTEQPMAAINALQAYIDQVENPQHRYDAELLLQDVRESLN